MGFYIKVILWSATNLPLSKHASKMRCPFFGRPVCPGGTTANLFRLPTTGSSVLSESLPGTAAKHSCHRQVNCHTTNRERTFQHAPYNPPWPDCHYSRKFMHHSRNLAYQPASFNKDCHKYSNATGINYHQSMLTYQISTTSNKKYLNI